MAVWASSCPKQYMHGRVFLPRLRTEVMSSQFQIRVLLSLLPYTMRQSTTKSINERRHLSPSVISSAGYVGETSCGRTKHVNAGCVCGPAVCIMDEHQPLVPPSERCVRPQRFTDHPARSRRRNEGRRRSWLLYDATSRASCAGSGGPCASQRTPIGSRGACPEPPSRHGVLVFEL